MGATAASLAIGGMTARRARKDRKEAEEDAKQVAERARLDSEKLKAEQVKEEAKLAAMTPTPSMDTTTRVAAEKAIMMRRRGRGQRANTMEDTTYSVG